MRRVVLFGLKNVFNGEINEKRIFPTAKSECENS